MLGAVALGGAGVPVPERADPPARATATLSSQDAGDVVLRVSAADGGDPVPVGAPGAVVGLAVPATAAAATVASVVPPGLAGPPGSTGPLGVPDRVLAAYRFAETELARTRPGCAMPWWVLAGIGKVESGHAGGGRVDADGRTRGEVLGPLLDGSLAGTMVIRDTDGGVMDGDTGFDRAVGPMQFLPGTWRSVGTDADRDGTADPHDVDDAATTAGLYLCRGGGSMTDVAQLRSAVLRYNGSDAYVDAVLSWGTSYRDRVVAVPGRSGSIAPPAAPAPVPTAVPGPAPTTGPTTTPTTSAPTRPPTAPPTPVPTSPGPTAPAPSGEPTTVPTTAPTTSPDPEPTGGAPAP